MNMSNTQTGRHIPFETGSINMHSLLALQTGDDVGAAVPAAAAARQALILMFLSLPVFQVRQTAQWHARPPVACTPLSCMHAPHL